MREKIVYYSDTMKHFGERMLKYMGFRKYDPKTDVVKEVFFQSLYMREDYNTLAEHKGKKTIYWNGSDLMRMMLNKSWYLQLYETKAIHLCHSDWQREVLRRLGINCEIYPIFFGDTSLYPICFKPSKKPQVFITSHNNREEEYGVDRLREVAPEVPDVTIHVYGQDGDNTDNLIFHGWVDEDVMDEEIKGYQGAIKGGSNGISITLAKSMFMGQYPISYLKIPGVWHAPDKESLIKQLNRLKEQKEPNFSLRKKYEKHFKPV